MSALPQPRSGPGMSALLLISKKEKAMRKNVFEKSTSLILLIAFAVVLLFSLFEVYTVRDFNRVKQVPCFNCAEQ